MSNSSLKNINSAKREQNEHENDESVKNNENTIKNRTAQEKIVKNNIEVMVKYNDDSLIKVESLGAPSIDLKDIKMDMEEKIVSKNNSKRSTGFNFFLKNLKNPKNTEKSKNLNHRKKTKMCVLFC